MFLLVCKPDNSPEITTSPTSICCTSAGSYCGPITSGHNDIATEKQLSKFGTTLFGYLNSMTFILLFTQTALPCIYLVRAMSQLHFNYMIGGNAFFVVISVN